MNILASLSACRLKWVAVIAGTILMAAATGAWAQQKAGPCVDDVAKLCQGVKPGGGNILNCLNGHTNELSPACKDNMAKINSAIVKMKAKAEEFVAACNTDVTSLCKGVKPGEGRLVMCLKQNESKLSPACKNLMSKTKAPAKK